MSNTINKLFKKPLCFFISTLSLAGCSTSVGNRMNEQKKFNLGENKPRGSTTAAVAAVSELCAAAKGFSGCL